MCRFRIRDGMGLPGSILEDLSILTGGGILPCSLLYYFQSWHVVGTLYIFVERKLNSMNI